MERRGSEKLIVKNLYPNQNECYRLWSTFQEKSSSTCVISVTGSGKIIRLPLAELESGDAGISNSDNKNNQHDRTSEDDEEEVSGSETNNDSTQKKRDDTNVITKTGKKMVETEDPGLLSNFNKITSSTHKIRSQRSSKHRSFYVKQSKSKCVNRKNATDGVKKDRKTKNYIYDSNLSLITNVKDNHIESELPRDSSIQPQISLSKDESSLKDKTIESKIDHDSIEQQQNSLSASKYSSMELIKNDETHKEHSAKRQHVEKPQDLVECSFKSKNDSDSEYFESTENLLDSNKELNDAGKSYGDGSDKLKSSDAKNKEVRPHNGGSWSNLASKKLLTYIVFAIMMMLATILLIYGSEHYQILNGVKILIGTIKNMLGFKRDLTLLQRMLKF